ncbi:hypothetical protein Tco_1165116 [Tanacetum coccineum]
MLRTNSQAKIVSKEQLVPRANRLVIKKNNQRVASDSHITDTMLRFVVEILRHHKLYNPVSLTTTLPLPDPNNTYIQPPSEIQILEFIKTLGYDEDPETKLISISKMVSIRLHQPWRAILSVLNRYFTSLIWDEFEWQTVERPSIPLKMSKLLYTRFTKLIIDYLLSLKKSIPRRSDSKLHSSQDDHTITKLLSTTNVESEKAKIVDKPEEQHVSPIKSRRGKGFMCYGDQVENVPNKLKKDVVLRKTRSRTIVKEAVVGELANSISIQEPRSQQHRRSQLTIDSQTDEAIADMYNEWGQKLKGPAVEDPTVQSLLDLRKGSKASRLERLRQKKQPVAGEGSSVAHNKCYSSSDIVSDATLYSSSSKESTNETDDADESDMDLSNDNPHGDDDDARYGVFMHNKSTTTPNSTYFSPTVTSSSLDFIQTLLDETPANELTDFMSHPVYTDAQTTSVMHNPEGNPELTSYISDASEVPLGTHVDVLETKTLMQEMFSDDNAHHIPSLQQRKFAILQRIPNQAHYKPKQIS